MILFLSFLKRKDEDYAFVRIRKDSLIIFLKCVLNIFNFHSIENIKIIRFKVINNEIYSG